MTRKIVTRTISVMLILFMTLSILPIANISAGATEIRYISEITAAVKDSGKAQLENSGYTIVDSQFVDKNSDWVYIGYKTTTDKDDAITGLVFSTINASTINYKGRTYTKNGGHNISERYNYYLYFTKEKDRTATTEYITSLALLQTPIFKDDHRSCKLYGKNYKVVGSTENNCSFDFNNASGKTFYNAIYLVYESVLDPDAYTKQGENNLANTVKAVNDVAYYNVQDNTASSNFMKSALSAEYNGTSQVELWADILYSMLEIKGQGNGYRNDTGKSFDDIYGKGEYIDMVAALKNGAGNYNNSSYVMHKCRVTGLQSANNPQEVYDEVIKMFTTLTHGSVGLGCSDYSYENIESEVVDLDGLKNLKSSSDVLYSICRVADEDLDGSESKGHDKSTTVMGMMFYNFEFVPILENGVTGEDALNYSKEIKSVGSKNVSTDIVVNNTAYDANRDLGFSSTTTDSITNSISSTNGKSVAYTQDFSIQANTAKLLPLSITGGLSIGFSEAFDFSETKGNSVTFDESHTTSTSVSEMIPAYSIGVTQREASKAEVIKSYDCPMAVTYDVALFSTGAELGKENIFYTSFAYNSSLFATFGDETNSAQECLNTILTTGGTKTNGFSVICIDGDNNKLQFDKYTTGDWNNIINNNVASGEYPIKSSDAMSRIADYQPMSFNGGKFTSDVDNITYKLDSLYSILPIDKISVFKTNYASQAQTYVSKIDLTERKEYSLGSFYDTIVGYTENNTEFTNWDMSQGYWMLVQEDGTEIPLSAEQAVSDGVISVRKDKVTGNVYITPISNGSSYMEYRINETGYFQYYDYDMDSETEFDTNRIKNCTNDMITRKGTIEIVSNIE